MDKPGSFFYSPIKILYKSSNFVSQRMRVRVFKPLSTSPMSPIFLLINTYIWRNLLNLKLFIELLQPEICLLEGHDLLIFCGFNSIHSRKIYGSSRILLYTKSFFLKLSKLLTGRQLAYIISKTKQPSNLKFSRLNNVKSTIYAHFLAILYLCSMGRDFSLHD